MKNKTCDKAGFTLIEIMIVVAIIALLGSMATVSYGKARERAYAATCIGNLQKIDGAIHAWSLETRKDEGQPVTYNDIRPYLRGSLVCPAGGSSFEDSYTISTVEAPPLCQRKPAMHKLAE